VVEGLTDGEPVRVGRFEYARGATADDGDARPIDVLAPGCVHVGGVDESDHVVLRNELLDLGQRRVRVVRVIHLDDLYLVPFDATVGIRVARPRGVRRWSHNDARGQWAGAATDLS